MEFRYVYRGLEDVIGQPLAPMRHPHSVVSQRLRALFREQRDVSRNRELTALCLSSLAGNKRIDTTKASETVNKLLSDAFALQLPYTKEKKKTTASETDEQRYARYFRILKRMKEDRDRQTGNSDSSDSSDSPQGT